MGDASDPALFLHRLDVPAGRAAFVRTDRIAIRSASFLDGREAFWRGPVRDRPTAALPRALRPCVGRYVFHVGFCGSTLLARLLDAPDQTLVLREPQALTDLAVYRAALDRAGGDDVRLEATSRQARDMLFRRWADEEAVVVKPSNWVNNILPALCAERSLVRPLFLSADRRSFLLAVFRGGSDRLAFVARAAIHFSSHGIREAEWVAAALAAPGDRHDQFARLAVLTHRLQHDLFRKVAASWPDAHWLDFATLRADPASAVSQARAALDLPPPRGAPSSAFAWHAKQPDQPFSEAEERAMNIVIEQDFGRTFDQACAWIDEALPAIG